MRVRALAVGFCIFFLFFFVLHLSASNKPTPANGYGTYVEIPGASRVGSDTCMGCHADTSKNFQHAFHKQQNVECEDCHGNGSLHVDGGGDVAKIVSFRSVRLGMPTAFVWAAMPGTKRSGTGRGIACSEPCALHRLSPSSFPCTQRGKGKPSQF